MLKFYYILIASWMHCSFHLSGSLTLPQRTTSTSQLNIDRNKPERKFSIPKYQKRHEIINILWRKTKIFDYVDKVVTTLPYQDLIPNVTTQQPQKHAKKYIFTPNFIFNKVPVSTPISNIEFYYFDSPTNNKVNFKPPYITLSKNKLTKSTNIININSTNHKSIIQKKHFNMHYLGKNDSITLRSRKFENMKGHRSKVTKSTNLKGETSKIITPNSVKPSIRATSTCSTSKTRKNISKLKPSPHDKVNFFEIHDFHTEKPLILSKESTEHTRMFSNNTKSYKIYEVPKKRKPKDVNTDMRSTISHITNEKEESQNVTFLGTEIRNFTKSKSIVWHEYPFLAAYIHENSQVHCDAGAISYHWLITAGSCLYRHHKDPVLDARSAFVTYCGLSWRNPGRIAYVKYSVVHPHYHPQDESRHHLYNVGLIQVSTSMLSCGGWNALPLTTHLFTADKLGSPATAVGWGLNRFCSKQYFIDVPKTELMQYDGVIYSNDCPGNTDFSQLKLLPERGGSENVYCLLLPPYKGESQDPVHGGLLLVAGKLIALYLEEERHSAGLQTAQYTGVWRLLPWIYDVARESSVPDTLSIDT